jgi:large subunit ribosomal protein L17
MKHRTSGRKLKREKGQRTALHKIMLGNFIMREKITTTQAKAKEIKALVDQIVRQAKAAQDPEKKVTALRYLSKKLPAIAVKKLAGDFSKRFSSRNSGYCRVIKLPRRKSDDAAMAIIEFV